MQKTRAYETNHLALKREVFKEKTRAFILHDRYDCQYMTGYTGELFSYVITENMQYLVVNSLYMEQVKQETDHITPIDAKNKPVEAVKSILSEHGITHIAGDFSNEQQAIDQYGILSAISNAMIIKNLRTVKSEEELDRIRIACKIATDALQACLPLIKPGVREIEIAAELDYHMRKNGAHRAAFETIVVSGIRSAMPHGSPGEKMIRQGEPITIDFGAVYRSYCSDITRTIFVGPPSDTIKQIYEVVKSAQQEALDHIRSGVTGADADGIARDYIAKHGYGDYFVHGLGHGIGLQVHEGPALSKKNDQALLANQVVTVEPGIYVSNVGGVRIEDSVVVHDGGVEVLTGAIDKELLIL